MSKHTSALWAAFHIFHTFAALQDQSDKIHIEPSGGRIAVRRQKT
jgi:hypothetical protein